MDSRCAWYGAASPCNISPPDWGDHYLTQLQSTVLPATTGVIELRFRSHSHAEEDGIWDLREVEVSTDDGATWSKTGDVFNSGFGWRYEVCDLTRFAGVVVSPRRRTAAFRHMEFLPLSDKRILLIIVTADGDVQNRILKVDRLYSPAELTTASNFLNQHYAGLAFDAIQPRKSFGHGGADSERAVIAQHEHGAIP